MQVNHVIGKCREREVSINHPSGAEWCEHCKHYALLDFMRKCQCCLRKVTRRRTYRNEVKVFDRVVSENQSIIEYYIRNPYHSQFMPGFSVKIGYRTYLVSLPRMAEYYTMPNTRVPEKIGPFFAHMKSECLQLMPGTGVR